MIIYDILKTIFKFKLGVTLEVSQTFYNRNLYFTVKGLMNKKIRLTRLFICSKDLNAQNFKGEYFEVFSKYFKGILKIRQFFRPHLDSLDLTFDRQVVKVIQERYALIIVALEILGVWIIIVRFQLINWWRLKSHQFAERRSTEIRVEHK